MKRKQRNSVFISYSHKDRQWLERLKTHLTPLERNFRVDIWEDTKIRPGSNWRKELQKALDSARIAILLISADFLASEFISKNELPPLLKAAEDEGATVLPVIVAPSLFTYLSPLSQFQSVNDPSKSLISLPEGEQEEILLKVAVTLLQAITKDLGFNHEHPEEPEVLDKEDFLKKDHWSKLIKLGDWIYDAKNSKFIGSGMNSYILSRSEYGDDDFSIRARLKFSNFGNFRSASIGEFNAGFLFGWKSEKANPQYHNILITGKQILLERIGIHGGDAYRDYEHVEAGTKFIVTEDQFYEFFITFTDKKISVLLNEKILCHFKTQGSVFGRVGLRPWRSQIECDIFEITRE